MICSTLTVFTFLVILLMPGSFKAVHSSLNDRFSESLTIKPLSDGKLLTHFEFSVTLDKVAEEGASFNHYNLFPRALGQIVQSYKARELHLTFTQGRWDYEEWGYPLSSSAGTGVELWAWLWKSERLNENWKSLTNALAGLFCASLNFIDETNTVQPQLSFRPEGPYNVSELYERAELRSGALPHENVCTENLTPWVKLLPCKSTAGIASLLNGHELYNSNFHSMGIHVRPICQDPNCKNQQLEILQTLSTVVDPVKNNRVRDWSINKLYSRKMERTCPLASESKLRLILPQEGDYEIIPDADHVIEGQEKGPDIAVYDLKKAPMSLNLSMKWNETRFEYDTRPVQPRIFAHRYFSGYGQERGGVKINIFNKSPEVAVPIIYYDVIPWYLKLYLHTLKIQINGKTLKSGTADYPIKDIYYQPAIDRSRPNVIESLLLLPPNSIATLSISFDKVFLKYTEHPPDANRGFDIGSAVITIGSNKEDIHRWDDAADILNESINPIRIYTETLLVSLPTPDFSMPYNVITLTCTVIALFFGSMFNLLTRNFVGLPKKLDKNPQTIEEENSNSSANNSIISQFKQKTEIQGPSADYNSDDYKNYRPIYHPRLYENLYSYHRERYAEGRFIRALDVATGTGQVAYALARTFTHVEAIDISPTMLKSAIQAPNITYSLSRAEDLSLFQTSSMDLITISQAAHWVQMRQFFIEANRVLKPGGTLAIWGYAFIILNGYEKATEMIERYGKSEDQLGRYWEEGRKLLNELHKDLKVPETLFEDVRWEMYPKLKIGSGNQGSHVSIAKKPILEADFTVDLLRRYLKTWSSYKNFENKNPKGNNIIDKLIEECRKIEGWTSEEQMLHVSWPHVIILARNRK
ncbi:hypothetical protein G9A89_017191 [Geosiphon pyriformis]|nr:hypothetical protein G9A89_017191 [Geosiphon pyriformis]